VTTAFTCLLSLHKADATGELVSVEDTLLRYIHYTALHYSTSRTARLQCTLTRPVAVCKLETLAVLTRVRYGNVGSFPLNIVADDSMYCSMHCCYSVS
jgi:hypothetical protein